MGISFVKNGPNVLINDGSTVTSAPGSAFVRPHPTKPGAIVISEKANPQNEYDGITILVASVTAPTFTDRNDLITKLSTDFFFRVSGGGSSFSENDAVGVLNQAAFTIPEKVKTTGVYFAIIDGIVVYKGKGLIITNNASDATATFTIAPDAGASIDFIYSPF